MMHILEITFYIVGIFVGIALIVGAQWIIYFLIKYVYLDIKEAKNYGEYYKKLYQSKYESEIEVVRNDYERLLKSRSEEYFRKFYEEDKKKRLEEENQNGN